MIFHQQDPLLSARGFGPVRRAGEAAVRRRRGALLERGGGERRRPHQVLRGRPQEGTGRARGKVLREGDAVRVEAYFGYIHYAFVQVKFIYTVTIVSISDVACSLGVEI